MTAPVQCLRICWIIFMVYWFVSAFRQRATAERVPRLKQLGHRLPVTLGAVLLLWPQRNRPWEVWLAPSSAGTWAGAGICALGLAIAIWARWTLAGNWSGNVTFKQGHELIVRGPYRFVRHPIYTGLLLMGLGTALVERRANAFVGVCLWFAGFWIKLRLEEQLMTRHFPSEYPAYMKRVKALIPFVL